MKDNCLFVFERHYIFLMQIPIVNISENVDVSIHHQTGWWDDGDQPHRDGSVGCGL